MKTTGTTAEKKQKIQEVNSDINVTPMVDVMLVLLIIFMVITPMLQKGVSVDLAQGRQPDEDAGRRQGRCHLVAITRDGKVFLGSDTIAPDQLTKGERQASDQNRRKACLHQGRCARPLRRRGGRGGQRPFGRSGPAGSAYRTAQDPGSARARRRAVEEERHGNGSW